jgi:hypothetical protein
MGKSFGQPCGILTIVWWFVLEQERYKELVEDRTYLYSVLREGAESAEEVAEATTDWAKNAMGFTNRKELLK